MVRTGTVKSTINRHPSTKDTRSDEQAVAVAKASVMLYDETNKKWVSSGSDGEQAISKVQIFQHQVHNTFRIVGRKVNDHEVVINCAITAVLKYHQATPTFHQWRDQRQVYGLNFASSEDAANFAAVLRQAMEIVAQVAAGLTANGHPQQHRPSLPAQSSIQLQQPTYAQAQPQRQQPPIHNGNSAPNFRSMPGAEEPHLPSEYASNDDIHAQNHLHGNQESIHNGHSRKSNSSSLGQQQQHQRRASQGSSGGSSTHSGGSSLIYAQQQQQLNTPNVPSPVRGAAPPAPPPPPPIAGLQQAMKAPLASTSGAPPPPPGPPPPPSALRGGAAGGSNGLAQALQAAKLRKTSAPASVMNGGENGRLTTPLQSNGSSRGGGDLMSELAATMARRKVKVDNGEEGGPTSSSASPRPSATKPWENRNGNTVPDSPRAQTKGNNIRRMPSGTSLSSTEDQTTLTVAGTSTVPVRAVNGTSASNAVVTQEMLDEWRQDIMNDVRRELEASRREIVEEFYRMSEIRRNNLKRKKWQIAKNKAPGAS